LRKNSELYNESKDLIKEIPFSFAKFLVSEEGKVIYFNPISNPQTLVSEIELYLNYK